MRGLGIDLKRTEEINLLLSPRLRGFGISLIVLVDGVASRCPRVGLDAIEREEVLSCVRRACFLSGGDGGVGGAQ